MKPCCCNEHDHSWVLSVVDSDGDEQFLRCWYCGIWEDEL